MNTLPIMRVARPTANLAALTRMYVDGLGLSVLGEFSGDSGFDGVMLGRPGGPYHLEFTSKAGHVVGPAPDEDHLLVFYVEDPAEYELHCTTMLQAGFVEVDSFNPYWSERGRTFADLDRYRIVIQNAAWPV